MARLSAFALSILLAGCPRGAHPVDPDAGVVDPGNSFEGPIAFDDDRLMRIDPSTLPSPSSTSCRPPLLARVTRVIDGDTAHVRGVSEIIDDLPVRLIGVDTPEIAHPMTSTMPASDAECYGPEGQTFTNQLLDRLVWLTFDAGCDDLYMRKLAYVWIGSGQGDLWQRQLLRRGFASTLSIPPNTAMASTFAQDQSTAQGAGIGMWTACR